MIDIVTTSQNWKETLIVHLQNSFIWFPCTYIGSLELLRRILGQRFQFAWVLAKCLLWKWIPMRPFFIAKCQKSCNKSLFIFWKLHVIFESQSYFAINFNITNKHFSFLLASKSRKWNLKLSFNGVCFKLPPTFFTHYTLEFSWLWCE